MTLRSGLSRRFDLMGDPGVEGEPLALRTHRGFAVHLRSEPKGHLSAVGPSRLLAALCAEGQIVVDAFSEGPFHLGERLAFEGDHIPEAVTRPRKAPSSASIFPT
jgi:hypothetical protein